MEGGYQIIPLRHINLGAAPHTIKGVYRFIEDNVADKAALLEGLRISGTDYNSVFTTFEKDPETGTYHGSFIVDKEMFTLIVRSDDIVNVTHINIKTIQTDASDIYDVIADEWNALTTYSVGDKCIYNNVLYECLIQNSGQNPSTATAYWKMVKVTELTGGLSEWKVVVGSIVGNDPIALPASFNELYIEIYIRDNTNVVLTENIARSALLTTEKRYRFGYFFTTTSFAGAIIGATLSQIHLIQVSDRDGDATDSSRITVYVR